MSARHIGLGAGLGIIYMPAMPYSTLCPTAAAVALPGTFPAGVKIHSCVTRLYQCTEHVLRNTNTIQQTVFVQKNISQIKTVSKESLVYTCIQGAPHVCRLSQAHAPGRGEGVEGLRGWLGDIVTS